MCTRMFSITCLLPVTAHTYVLSVSICMRVVHRYNRVCVPSVIIFNKSVCCMHDLSDVVRCLLNFGFTWAKSSFNHA